MLYMTQPSDATEKLHPMRTTDFGENGNMLYMKKLDRAVPPRNTRPHYIREWRKYYDLSQEKVASRINMHKGSISRLENFETKYTQETLEAIAWAIGHNLEPADLLYPPPNISQPENDLERYVRKMRARKELDRFTRMAAAFLGEDAA